MNKKIQNNGLKKYRQQRPWGDFEQFTKAQPVTVKILTVKPFHAISLQYHRNRSEFWKVINGRGKVTVGEAVQDAIEGDEFFVPKGRKHRIETGASEIKIMEISSGDFDENDIVRLEDRYNRI